MPNLQQTTFTLDDLRARADGRGPLPPEVRLAVLGSPVEHSLSPAMHNAALEALGSDLRYAKIECPPEDLAAAVDLAHRANFLGLNLTIPHKFAALELCTELDDTARQLGAVNTLLFDGSRTAGFNTDGPGLVRAIREVFSFDLRDLRVMVLGAGGGAGSAAALQCALEKCPRLVLVNRTENKAHDIAQRAAELLHTDRLEGPEDPVTVIPLEPSALREQLTRTDLVINATSLGMKRTDPRLIPAAILTPDLMVYDMIYRPALTRLLEDAKSTGARTANGLSLLLHQGALSLEIWLNRPAPLDVMRRALDQVTA
ncbi:MAG: shikimate dehydrogenase [Chthoniobacterales bacterium]|nr:shikimate dehydrogenase [Chthoniobacterales bacterium]